MAEFRLFYHRDCASNARMGDAMNLKVTSLIHRHRSGGATSQNASIKIFVGRKTVTNQVLVGDSDHRPLFDNERRRTVSKIFDRDLDCAGERGGRSFSHGWR